MDRHYFRSEQSVTFCTFYIRYGLMESGSVPIQWEYYGESRNFDLSPSPPPLEGIPVHPSQPQYVTLVIHRQPFIPQRGVRAFPSNTAGMARTQTARSGVQSTVI